MCTEPPETYCNKQNECWPLCETHEDCVWGYCSCEMEISLCSYYYCRDGECPDFTEPVIGTRVCKPKADYLEGECHSPACMEGYERVGERGCVRVNEEQ